VGYLSKVGIKVDLKIRDSNTHWDLETKKQLEPMFFDSWGSSNGEAIQRLQGTLNKGESYANWDDANLQALIQQASTTVDPAKRLAVYQQIEKTMFDNPPFIYLLQEVSFAALRTRVQGFSMYPWEAIYLWQLSVSDGK
jgi:peptide/nickel transport system substrate-binding protein